MRAVEILKAMPIEELRRLVEESRLLTSEQVEQRQRAARWVRAVAAAEALAESTKP